MPADGAGEDEVSGPSKWAREPVEHGHDVVGPSASARAAGPARLRATAGVVAADLKARQGEVDVAPAQRERSGPGSHCDRGGVGRMEPCAEIVAVNLDVDQVRAWGQWMQQRDPAVADRLSRGSWEKRRIEDMPGRQDEVQQRCLHFGERDRPAVERDRGGGQSGIHRAGAPAQRGLVVAVVRGWLEAAAFRTPPDDEDLRARLDGARELLAPGERGNDLAELDTRVSAGDWIADGRCLEHRRPQRPE